MLAEKADLEKRFADLSEVNQQIRKLREEAYVARRMEVIRNGVVGTDRKGAQLLQEGIRRPASPAAPATDSSLDAEVKASGAAKAKQPGNEP